MRTISKKVVAIGLVLMMVLAFAIALIPIKVAKAAGTWQLPVVDELGRGYGTATVTAIDGETYIESIQDGKVIIDAGNNCGEDIGYMPYNIVVKGVQIAGADNGNLKATIQMNAITGADYSSYRIFESYKTWSTTEQTVAKGLVATDSSLTIPVDMASVNTDSHEVNTLLEVKPTAGITSYDIPIASVDNSTGALIDTGYKAHIDVVPGSGHKFAASLNTYVRYTPYTQNSIDEDYNVAKGYIIERAMASGNVQIKVTYPRMDGMVTSTVREYDAGTQEWSGNNIEVVNDQLVLQYNAKVNMNTHATIVYRTNSGGAQVSETALEYQRNALASTGNMNGKIGFNLGQKGTCPTHVNDDPSSAIIDKQLLLGGEGNKTTNYNQFEANKLTSGSEYDSAKKYVESNMSDVGNVEVYDFELRLRESEAPLTWQNFKDFGTGATISYNMPTTLNFDDTSNYKLYKKVGNTYVAQAYEVDGKNIKFTTTTPGIYVGVIENHAMLNATGDVAAELIYTPGQKDKNGVPLAGSTFTANKITSGNKYDEAVKLVNTAAGVSTRYDIYDFSIINGTDEIHEIDGDVIVAMPLPTGLTESELANYKMYSVVDGKLVERPYTVKDGKMYATTNHFSTYVGAFTADSQNGSADGNSDGSAASASSNSQTTNTTSTTVTPSGNTVVTAPKTGDPMGNVLLILVAVAAVTGAVVSLVIIRVSKVR